MMEDTAIAMKSDIETQITSLEHFIDDMTFTHPSKDGLMEMKVFLNNLTSRLDEIIVPETKDVSSTNCTQLIVTKKNFDMVLSDIEKILAQIEVIGVTGNDEVDSYLADLKTYYIGVEVDITATIAALQQRIALECPGLTSTSDFAKQSSVSSTFVSSNGPVTKTTSESAEPTKNLPSSTTLDLLPRTTGNLLTTTEREHVPTTKEGQEDMLTTRHEQHLLTTAKQHLLTTEHPMLTTQGEVVFTTRPSVSRFSFDVQSVTTSTASPPTFSTLDTSVTTSGLCCRIKTVTSGSLQGRWDYWYFQPLMLQSNMKSKSQV